MESNCLDEQIIMYTFGYEFKIIIFKAGYTHTYMQTNTTYLYKIDVHIGLVGPMCISMSAKSLPYGINILKKSRVFSTNNNNKKQLGTTSKVFIFTLHPD